jgi:predicted outer membrane repeat protein
MAGEASVSGAAGAGVSIGQNALLVMGEKSSISGNTGCGVDNLYASYTGLMPTNIQIFMLDEAAIFDNTDSGIYAVRSALTIGGRAKITRNRTTGNGGGIRICWTSSLTLTDFAQISGNYAAGKGGGIYAQFDEVTQSTPIRANIEGSAVISGNTADAEGGGVYVVAGGLAMNGEARVVNNTSQLSGGGIAVSGGGNLIHTQLTVAPTTIAHGGFFVLQGGLLSGNRANSGFGGGVFVRLREGTGTTIPPGTFLMEGGLISQNSSQKGGGVAVSYEGVFEKTGSPSGSIYGSNAAPGEENTSSGSLSAAVWIGSDALNATLKELNNTVTPAKILTGAYSGWSD